MEQTDLPDLTFVTYAGFRRRVCASLIDNGLMMIVIVPLTLWGGVLSNSFVYFLTSWVFPVAFVLGFWRVKSATPGKLAMAVKIVRMEDNGAPSWGQLIGRYFAKILSLLPLGLGYLWVALDDDKQGWHDKLAGTAVIRTDPAAARPWRLWCAVLLVAGLLVSAVGLSAFLGRAASRMKATAGKIGPAAKAFAAGRDNAACLDEALRRAKSGGFLDQVEASVFLSPCLEASAPTPGFCDGVPSRGDFSGSGRWVELQKNRTGCTSPGCQSVFGEVQDFCGKAPARKEETT